MLTVVLQTFQKKEPLVGRMDSDRPPPMRETWDEFLTALRVPVHEDFDAIYWVCRISRDLFLWACDRVGLGRRRMRSAIPWLRPVM